MLVSAFRSDGTGSGLTLEDVFAVDPTTGALTPVVADPEASVVHPAWSPDGGRIALCSSTGWPGGRVRVVDPLGAEVASFARGGEPSWFDDDTLLVHDQFWLHTGENTDLGVHEVFALHLPSGRLTQVTRFTPDVEVGNIHWHPRAGLAMDVRPRGTDPWTQERLAVIPAAAVRKAVDVGTPVAVGDLKHVDPFGPGWICAQPHWSPDGTRLVFVRRRRAMPIPGAPDLAVVQVGSAAVSLLHTHGTLLSEPPWPAGQEADDYAPVYSPDGTQVAWNHGHRDQWREVWVMAADGTNKRQLTHLDRLWVVAHLTW